MGIYEDNQFRTEISEAIQGIATTQATILTRLDGLASHIVDEAPHATATAVVEQLSTMIEPAPAADPAPAPIAPAAPVDAPEAAPVDASAALAAAVSESAPAPTETASNTETTGTTTVGAAS